ncbi:MAG: TlyA family RNA methyltransferase [Planctomycetes bacterium]|nr:TlyA family RNA methyltransferase [Planctomycetota bacterium]
MSRSTDGEQRFVSRAGLKLAHALDAFDVSVAGLVCADLGSNAGGFVDCLLQAGAKKVFAIERGYGVLDFRLRRDPRVIVMERTDALKVRLPELVGAVTIDAGWTRQRLILPPARSMLAPDGFIISLIKPHYEAEPAWLEKGILQESHLPTVLAHVRDDVVASGFTIKAEIESPIQGHGGNREFLMLLAALPRPAFANVVSKP